jgi:hydroxymethylglutaryl-CoA synthase
MSLGSAGARQLGNLYTGALFAWMAAGLDEAAREGREVAGARWLAIGYGSGDAAESIPVQVARDWRTAAARVRFSEALDGARELTRAEYEGLHDGRPPESVANAPLRGFRIVRIGDTSTASYQDLGVEYYEYVA